MTSVDALLKLDIRLLLLRYGRRRVLDALAGLTDHTPEELEREIATAEDRKTKKKARTSSTSEMVASVFRDRPELVPTVEQLMNRYENKTFLPQLRDVQQFLDRVAGTRTRLKSRKTAIGPLLRALSSMKADDIPRLTAAAETTSGDSDFALLARAIMTGSSGRKR